MAGLDSTVAARRDWRRGLGK